MGGSQLTHFNQTNLRKTLISSLILATFLVPSVSSAQAEPVTQSQLQQQLDALQAQLIALLQQQLAELVAQLNALVAAQAQTNVQLGAVQNQVESVVANQPVAQVAQEPTVVSLGNPICKESNVQVPIIGEIPQGYFSWMTYQSQNNQPQFNSPKVRTETGRGGTNQYLLLPKWDDTYEISGKFNGAATDFTQTVSVDCE